MMLAFHGDANLKQFYVTRVQEAISAGKVVKRQYWKDESGCAVGVTVRSENHDLYETDLGIPAILAFVEEYLFENMHLHWAVPFPQDFLEAIPVGADLSKVWPRLLDHYLSQKRHDPLWSHIQTITEAVIAGQAVNLEQEAQRLIAQIPTHQKVVEIRHAAIAAIRSLGSIKGFPYHPQIATIFTHFMTFYHDDELLPCRDKLLELLSQAPLGEEPIYTMPSFSLRQVISAF